MKILHRTHKTAFVTACVLTGLMAGLVADALAETGLPLPRFVSVRAEKAKLRTGPGRRYPVEWIYVRRDLPVQIVAEFDTWRKIRDWNGVEGWVHQSLLSGRRYLIVDTAEVTVRADPTDDSPPHARFAKGVIARLESCPADLFWCRIERGPIKGWIPRDTLWGLLPDEVIE